MDFFEISIDTTNLKKIYSIESTDPSDYKFIVGKVDYLNMEEAIIIARINSNVLEVRAIDVYNNNIKTVLNY